MENDMNDVKQRVTENFGHLRDELTERSQELRETLHSYVDENPLAAVGVAFGVGYLLSGALFSRTTFRAASLGGRFVLGGFLKQLVAGIGPGMLMAALGGREQEAGVGSRGNGNQQNPQR